MNSRLGNPYFIFGLVLLWRILLLVFTAQPIPGSDAFGYDGAVVNYLHGGKYCNPSFSVIFPIAGTQVYAGYPPLYQAALLVWMKLFGTSAISAMALHLTLFALAGFMTLALVKRYFPTAVQYALIALLFFGFTFGDRPESLGYVFGLASLWLVLRQLSEGGFCLGTTIGLLFALLLTLYTSVIVGAYFFGAGFLACAAACCWRRRWHLFLPFAGAALLFAVITLSIKKFEPLWWDGFMESARQQTVVSNGFHLPHASDIIKLIRTEPVFLVGLAALPLVAVRRKEIVRSQEAWLAMMAGIFVAGWGLMFAAVTLLSANYVSYVMFTQIMLAAGLLALAQKYFPAYERWLRLALLACILLVSVRAVGISTWGVACSLKNSYQSTQSSLRAELAPFTASTNCVLVSSAYLYCAADINVKAPVYADWYFDHAQWVKNGNEPVEALTRLKPSKLVLTQFDYYRSFAAPLDALWQHPELVGIHVRDQAAIKPPDASPSLQRVVQNISWAPVFVDLDWKQPPSP